MNENPGGTPNPLNPSMPSQPRPETSGPIKSNGSTSRPVMDVISTQNVQPAQNAAAPQSIQTRQSPQTPPPVDDFSSFSPTAARPMEKAPEPAPVRPKKKNIGLIIGAVVCGVVALGCIIAAIVVALTANQSDPVARAVEKIMSGNIPTNTSIDGTVKVTFNDASSDYTDANVALNAQVVNGSMINSATASLTTNLRDGGSFTLGLDEVYANTGDLYLKVNGLANVLKAGQSLTADNDATVYDGTNCVDDGTGLTNCDSEIVEMEDGGSDVLQSLSMFATMLGSIDNQWIRFSADDLSSMASTDSNNIIGCMTNLGEDINNNKNTISGLYSKYPLISSTNENLSVTSEKNPIYKVIFNTENISSFMAEAQNYDIFKDFSSCMGYTYNSVDSADLVEDIEELPALYVEVDGNYDFTRLYFTTSDDETDYVYDFDLSYPENVNISEPTDYKDFTEIMQNMLGGATVLEGEESTNRTAF